MTYYLAYASGYEGPEIRSDVGDLVCDIAGQVYNMPVFTAIASPLREEVLLGLVF